MQTAQVQWIGEQKFVAISPSGHAMTMDADGKSNKAPTPMELLLMALGACTAVGWSKQSTGSSTPLAELWNGREWQVWPTPSPSSEAGELRDVSCVATYACEAAGSYTNSSKVQVSLAEGLGAPAASTGQAKAVSYNTATLTGTIKPNQWAVSYHFEYGETTAYGSSVPVPDSVTPLIDAIEPVPTSARVPPLTVVRPV